MRGLPLLGSRLLLAASMQAAAGIGSAQTIASTLPPGLTQRELEDPLEPWSLEPGRASIPPPRAPTALPDTTGLAPEAEPGAEATLDEAVAPEVEGEKVLVVECRQLLVSDPRKAERLAALVHAGATLEDARRTLGSIDVDERSREYAIDDLQADLRAEIDTLSAGEWSRLREWRGRSSIYQVVSKEERARSAIPALGQGLDDSEMERLANRQRAIAGRSRPPTEMQLGDLQPASVVEQATPQYPPGIQESAEVTVQVEIGMSDDYVGARVVRSTNPQFDQAALDAAQRSSYRSARRNGIPERGNVTLNFRFVAPGQEPPPGTTPPGIPPPQD